MFVFCQQASVKKKKYSKKIINKTILLKKQSNANKNRKKTEAKLSLDISKQRFCLIQNTLHMIKVYKQQPMKRPCKLEKISQCCHLFFKLNFSSKKTKRL